MLNQHIFDYLNHYIKLGHSPNYAVFLDGNWGSGKTWLINKILDDHGKDKFLYVTLYGVTDTEEIERQFFQQLHPFLASKAFSIGTKLLSTVLRGNIGLDWDGDGKKDGNVSLGVPKVDLEKSLEKSNERILIFDDIERCRIPINDLLGYINSFVEHQGQKVILIGYEDKIREIQEKLSNIDDYEEIREKLIGRKFRIEPSIDDALKFFLKELIDLKEVEFDRELIAEITSQFKVSGSKNLRTIRYVISDFNLFMSLIPEGFKKNRNFVINSLKVLTAFSIEMKNGELKENDILDFLEDRYASVWSKEENRDLNNIEKFVTKYDFLKSEDLALNQKCWFDFFNSGTMDDELVTDSLKQSIYFRDDNTVDWVKLWNFRNLTDLEFDVLLKKVKTDLESNNITKVGVLKHVASMLLFFSQSKLVNEKISDIEKYLKETVDSLIASNKIDLPTEKVIEYDRTMNGHAGLGYISNQAKPFGRICKLLDDHVDDLKDKKIIENSEKLIALLPNEPKKFWLSLVYNDHDLEKYLDVSILCHIGVDEFWDNYLNIKNGDKVYIGYLFSGKSGRYENASYHTELIKELPWLKKIKAEGSKRIKKVGKLEAFIMEPLINVDIKKAIDILTTLARSKKAKKKATKKKVAKKKANKKKITKKKVTKK